MPHQTLADERSPAERLMIYTIALLDAETGRLLHARRVGLR